MLLTAVTQCDHLWECYLGTLELRMWKKSICDLSHGFWTVPLHSQIDVIPFIAAWYIFFIVVMFRGSYFRIGGVIDSTPPLMKGVKDSTLVPPLKLCIVIFPPPMSPLFHRTPRNNCHECPFPYFFLALCLFLYSYFWDR